VTRDDDGLNSPTPPRQRRGWKGWLPLLGKPLRRGVVLFVIVIIVEYLVVPELTGARKDLYLINRVNGYWMAAGVVLEALSLFCYGLLTRALLRPEGRPSLFTLFRIDLAAAAVAHVIPAGTLGSAGIGYRLFTAEGIPGVESGVMMAAKGLGSTVVLNVLLWLSLVVSIPLAGFHPIYVTVAIIGALIMLALGLFVLAVHRGTDRTARIVDRIGRRLPRGWGDRFGQAVQEASANFRDLAQDRRVLTRAVLWASMNWLLDAASLWCFVTAFGRLVNPVELFAAYGIANVAGALPVTPAGLGVVDSVAPLLLVSFGVTRNVATLGVLGWRLVNYWLPIPAGALAYGSLKVPRGAGLRAMRHAVSGMMSRGDPDHGPPGHSDGPSPDKPDLTGNPTGQDPPRADGSGNDVADTAESMPASDGSDPAGGPARGDFRVG
jgi:uncharacterized protein (TIRG00374 family)